MDYDDIQRMLSLLEQILIELKNISAKNYNNAS